MNKKIVILITLLLIISVFTIILLTRKEDSEMIEDGGVVKDIILDGYSEKINSKDIIFFEYKGEFYARCELVDGVLHINNKGGNSSLRDGTYFKLDYDTSNKELLNKLQEIVEKYQISKNNGHEYEVAGLPAGLGDSISIVYASDEKIWKSSNQNLTIREDAKNAIYEAFHDYAQDNNLDFTSSGSNVLLYDDADKEFVQGIWKGKHFGREYQVEFIDDYVKIYEDGKLKDNTKYTIIDGNVVVDKVKKGVDNPKNRYDYEEFNVISVMSKKNDFTMTAYFMKDSYSTCDLIKEK